MSAQSKPRQGWLSCVIVSYNEDYTFRDSLGSNRKGWVVVSSWSIIIGVCFPSKMDFRLEFLFEGNGEEVDD